MQQMQQEREFAAEVHSNKMQQEAQKAQVAQQKFQQQMALAKAQPSTPSGA